jgi:hypothetical protein
MTLFRQLDEEEIQSFQRWARENYKPFEPIKGIWHPIIQEECAKINAMAGLPSGLAAVET